MVCFVSSRTLRKKKHIVTCFFLPKGKPLLRDGQNKHYHVRNSCSRGVSFRQIQHLKGLNSIALGCLNFTAGLTLFLFTYIMTLGSQ